MPDSNSNMITPDLPNTPSFRLCTVHLPVKLNTTRLLIDSHL